MTPIADTHPSIDVPEDEYSRLLGFPAHHEPDERTRELSAQARAWFSANARPWLHLRPTDVHVHNGAVSIDGAAFHSARLRQRFASAQVHHAMLVAVSAGPECAAEARSLWEAGKPDESYFLQVFGAAEVEQLVALANNHVCTNAAARGLRALPHFSPGYTGWDVSEQTLLFDRITRGRTLCLPGPLDVLESGMLNPKHSLLAVIGLTADRVNGSHPPVALPCEGCGFSPCQFRRALYRRQRATRPAVLG